MSVDLVTRAVAAVEPSTTTVLLTRAKARVATGLSGYCNIGDSDFWFPVPPGTDTLPPPPSTTTNPNPQPPNSVEVPPDFDDSDLCYLFQDLLPVGTAPVYATELEPVYVIPPYTEEVPLLGITRTTLSVREYPYELTLPVTEMALVTKPSALFATMFSVEAGALILSGQAAAFTRTLKLASQAGEFTVAGNSSGFLLNQVIGANAGAFSATYQSAGLVYQRLPLAGSFGEFTVSGQDAARFLGKNFVASSGSFTLSGEAAALAKAYRLDAGSAGFVVDGKVARLSYEDFYASWATQTYGDAWLDLTDWWAD